MSTASAVATSPQQLHALFTAHFKAGDLDRLGELYEPGAILIPQPGQVATGVPQIREALAAFMALHGEFQMLTPRIIRGTDTAVLLADWTLSATAPNGSPIRLAGQTLDVVRRQPDGRWLFVIDSPFGLQSVQPRDC